MISEVSWQRGATGHVSVDGFDAWYAASRPEMVRLAFFLTGSQGVAEEVVQDAFVKVLQRWGRLDEPSAYLRTCVVNRTRSWHRRRVVALRRGPKVASADVHDDRIDSLRDSLAALPRRRREVIVLRYYGQLSVPEIAAALGCGEGTVKSSLHRGLAQLKEVLS